MWMPCGSSSSTKLDRETTPGTAASSFPRGRWRSWSARRIGMPRPKLLRRRFFPVGRDYECPPYRFFPLLEHPDFGLTLHPFDLASNKVLGLAGRLAWSPEIGST